MGIGCVFDLGDFNDWFVCYFQVSVVSGQFIVIVGLQSEYFFV